jgi:hypothetical protein
MRGASASEIHEKLEAAMQEKAKALQEQVARPSSLHRPPRNTGFKCCSAVGKRRASAT